MDKQSVEDTLRSHASRLTRAETKISFIESLKIGERLGRYDKIAFVVFAGCIVLAWVVSHIPLVTSFLKGLE